MPMIHFFKKTGYFVWLMLCCGATAWLTIYFSEMGHVIIQNRSDQVAQNIQIVYRNANTDKSVWIGDLPPNQTYKYPINYFNMNEFQLNIRYDLRQSSQTEIIEGYATHYNQKRYFVEMK